MIGRIILCPGPFTHPHLQHISTSDFNAKLTAVEHVLHVLAHHSQIIIAQTWWASINSCQICPNVILRITRRSCKHLVVQISSKEIITWHEMWQSLQPHHCIVWQWGFYPIHKTCKKWDMTLSSSMAMYSVMHDIIWCKKGTNGKTMSCSLLVCHMQIFKSTDLRTIGLWKWITFFWYAL